MWFTLPWGCFTQGRAIESTLGGRCAGSVTLSFSSEVWFLLKPSGFLSSPQGLKRDRWWCGSFHPFRSKSLFCGNDPGSGIHRGSVGRRNLVVESGRVSPSSVGFARSLINASALAKPCRTVPTVNPLVSVRHPGPAWTPFWPSGIQMEGFQGGINVS